MSVLQFEQVTRTFDLGDRTITALHETDLTLTRGDVALIMGPSGAGKSTLLSMAGTLLRPTSGRIFLSGIEISALSERELPRVRREKIGFIFQQFNLIASMTAIQNVAFVMSLRHVNGRHATQRALELLRVVGMEKRADHLPKKLSGGEQQRVAIARALANNPDLVLADEPTANLDGVHARNVMQTLSMVSREFGATVLAVSHDDRITEMANRVLWLEDGRVRDVLPDGSPAPAARA